MYVIEDMQTPLKERNIRIIKEKKLKYCNKMQTKIHTQNQKILKQAIFCRCATHKGHL